MNSSGPSRFTPYVSRARRAQATRKQSTEHGTRNTDYGLRTTNRAPCHPSPVTRHPSTAAFTLIEIMIAITILALVITAIYSSWTAILRASKAGLDAAASVQRARIAVRTLEDT